jgi:pyruvate kinase
LPVVDDAELSVIAEALERLREEMLAAERAAPELGRFAGEERTSAANLVRYLAFRSRDVRELQQALLRCGLSSLGRGEANVLASLDAVLDVVNRLRDVPIPYRKTPPSAPVQGEGRRLLAARATDLLGAPREGRPTRIMVTLPSAAEGDRRLVRSMLAAGMDVARINAVHDSPAAWMAMSRNVRDETRADGSACRVLIDTPGPKSRTGPPPGDHRWC